MQGSEEPVAAAVAREHPAGAVGAVGPGREADDEDRWLIRAEARHRRAPVGLIGVRSTLRDCNVLAPHDEAWAGAALADRLVELTGRRCRASPPPDADSGGCGHCHIEPEGGAFITMAVFPTRVQRRAQKGRRPAVHLDAYS
jgi:hypothetical protein